MSKSKYFIIAGIILGALGGLAYWNFIGCHTGSCPITSIWYHSTAYGALLGGLFGAVIMPQRNRDIQEENKGSI